MSRYFAELNYSLGDEDSSVEYALLSRGTRCVAAVAGSGGRVLPLIAKRPEKLVCFDVVEEQLHLTRLRVESARALDLEEYAAFWGYPPAPMSPRQREDRFETLPLPPEAAAALRALFRRAEWTEIIYIGRFERMFRSLARINRLFTGNAGRRLFECDSTAEQVEYLERSFPVLRWKIVLFLLANSTVLNSILYKGDFPKKNIPASTYANFLRIYDSLFRRIPVRESFFAQLSFFGRLISREAGLLEVDSAVFASIKDALPGVDLEYVRGDIVHGLAARPERFDFVSLSDVPSFLPAGSDSRYLQDLHPALNPGALVVARGNLRVIAPDTSGYEDAGAGVAELSGSEKTQLWHINAFRRTADDQRDLRRRVG
jgi:S-adenosylmethionine-diacylglycerol 3-amino-3-carboxypropyl transferase